MLFYSIKRNNLQVNAKIRSLDIFDKICLSFLQEALKALSLTLQSNAAYLQSVQNTNNPAKLRETEKYFLR